MFSDNNSLTLAPIKRAMKSSTGALVSREAVQFMHDLLLDYLEQLSLSAHEFAKISDKKTITKARLLAAVKNHKRKW
ncbi:MAG: hypothetical protein GF308_02910 [Candidatus Heimdallarchaeota archaeon]|nr:hypothetical protein [Candidatus Heimdallarchaeota archaeon]